MEVVVALALITIVRIYYPLLGVREIIMISRALLLVCASLD